MINKNQTKHDDSKSGINPVVAALVTGAVVGAGVAVAGAVVLRDEKNREKVKEVLHNAKDQAIGYVEDMQKQVEEKKEEAKEGIAQSRKGLGKAIAGKSY